MGKKQKKDKEFKSYEAYKKQYFPKLEDDIQLSTENPFRYGSHLAQEMLNKYKSMLRK